MFTYIYSYAISSARTSFALGTTLALAMALTFPVNAQTEAGLNGIRLSGDLPIQIESDRLEVREKQSQAVFSGNVKVVQDKTILKTAKMVVFYTNNGEGSAATSGSSDIDRLEVSGGVHITSENRTATGDAGSFNMKTEQLVLTGKKVVLTQDDNVIVGCRLVANTGTGKVKFTGCDGNSAGQTQTGGGRIQMRLDPKSRTTN